LINIFDFIMTMSFFFLEKNLKVYCIYICNFHSERVKIHIGKEERKKEYRMHH
jgi:hypothetical protein